LSIFATCKAWAKEYHFDGKIPHLTVRYVAKILQLSAFARQLKGGGRLGPFVNVLKSLRSSGCPF